MKSNQILGDAKPKNSDGDPVSLIERTYTHMIYATRTHHYILIQHFTRSHTHK